MDIGKRPPWFWPRGVRYDFVWRHFNISTSGLRGKLACIFCFLQRWFLDSNFYFLYSFHRSVSGFGKMRETSELRQTPKQKQRRMILETS
jgi:hypothetical protein